MFPDRGFGFITSDEGPDTFVHVLAADRSGVTLDLNAWFEYDLAANKRRPGKLEAANLRPLSRQEIEIEQAYHERGPVKFGEGMPGDGQ